MFFLQGHHWGYFIPPFISMDPLWTYDQVVTYWKKKDHILSLTPLPQPSFSSFNYPSDTTPGWSFSLSSKIYSHHIVDHIHEWNHRWYIYMIDFNPRFLFDSFPKSLLPPDVKDSTLSMPQNDDDTILKSFFCDMLYAQSGYFYIVLLNASHHTTAWAPTLSTSHLSNRIIGSVHH